MDKLQPILVYKFWIALGAALILSPIGWWMGTEPLIAELTTRTTAVEKAHSDVTRITKAAKTTPNPKWVEQLASLNTERQKMVDEQTGRFWVVQAPYLTFPAEIQKYLPDTYRGKFELLGQRFYRAAYEKELARVRKIVQPLAAGVEGKLYFKAPLPRAPGSPWLDPIIPTSDAIWNAQEDIWLLTSLMESIARVNQHSRSIVEAPIREIRNLRLEGGDRADLERRRKEKASESVDTKTATATATPAKGGRRNWKGDDDGPTTDPFKKLLDETPKGDGRQYSGFSLDIDLYGVFGTKLGGDKATNLSNSNAPSNVNSADDDANRGMGAGLVASPGGNRAAESRYIDDPSETQKYATRGFFMEVVMDLRELPQFQAELISGQFPVELSVVQWAEYTGDWQTPDFGRGRPVAGQSSGFSGATQTKEDPAVSAALSAYRKAMSDPYLARVAVAGILTLYRPPTPEAAKLFAKNTAAPAAADAAADKTPSEPADAQAGSESSAAGEGASAAKPADQPPAEDKPKPTESKTTASPEATTSPPGDAKPANANAKTE